MSDKLFRYEDTNKSKHNRYFRINDSNKEELPPSKHIIQVRGDEAIIEKKLWNQLFVIKEENKNKANKTQINKNLIDASDFSYNESLINMSFYELVELLNEFDSIHSELEKVIINFVKSP